MDDGTEYVEFEFGSYRVSPSRRQLTVEGRPLAITAKAFETLLVLLDRAGNVVSKDDLMLAVWPETVVEENNLIQQISLIRRLLGERVGDHIIL